MTTTNSFGARGTLDVAGTSYEIYRLSAVPGAEKLPLSLKILLENLLRHEDGHQVTRAQIETLANWEPQQLPQREIQFSPGRVLLQDFTGVPCVVDLASMREALVRLGGDPERINPQIPVELVIDHSVVIDVFGQANAFRRNVEHEYARNEERYRFLRWGQTAFQNFKVVPPGTGIVHQVNLEHLSRVVMTSPAESGALRAYPDTCVGTDSHTPMVNGLGVLAWGVGGIEAEAALLGQPVSMLIPQVVGFKLTGSIPAGATATDVVLTITELMRKHGVVGKFVEFFGEGVASVPLANRATIGNMSPEFGCTCSLFPIDSVTLDYLRLTGRSAEQIALVEAYSKEQGLWHDPKRAAHYSEVIELDLSSVEPSLAGPKRPQDRIPLRSARQAFRDLNTGEPRVDNPVVVRTEEGTEYPLSHGSVAIAAITSCTNTSNPSVMLGAALLAKKAVERGLRRKPWVKTSLAPGSRVVMDYYEKAGLVPYLEELGFHLVGYGCTTCIGNSGPLIPEVSQAVREHDLSVASVLSGNRNFEGRINPDVKLNYLASPPLVVAYALAGHMDFQFETDPLGYDPQGQPVYLRDIWPSPQEIQEVIAATIDEKMFSEGYAQVFEGDEHWRSLPTPQGQTFAWEESSTYVQHPPYFEQMSPEPAPLQELTGARVLLLLGDSVTTDHISPAGSIQENSPAGEYLKSKGIAPHQFNSYGSRRGNHEVMVRGTFANIRLRNQLVPGVEGGFTKNFLTGQVQTVFDASQEYQAAGVPLIVLAGKEYGSGSSRDWAAKGPLLLGVRAVIAQSFERIHRSNLVGMGILPLEFPDGKSATELGLVGNELFEIEGIRQLESGSIPSSLRVRAQRADGSWVEFDARLRIDTPGEAAYFRHGGILPYVLRQLSKN